MKGKNNIILIKYQYDEGFYITLFFSVFLLLLAQLGFIIIASDPNNRILMFGGGGILIEIIFFIFLYVKNNKIKADKKFIRLMIFHSISINFGIICFFIVHPAFIIALFKYKELYILFFIQVLFYFIVAAIYTSNINFLNVIKNSYRFWIKGDKSKRYRIIFFHKDTLPSFIKPFSLLPAILLILLYFTTFINRAGKEAEYYMVLSAISFSAFMLYGYMCYIILLMRYFLYKRKFR
ncbi:hypothetical protein RO21_04430 [[Actinobacillus] muris]|uniref:Uncharacterized protein n=1 Tax=Muribacter muris TaxID=67855 RepID=A0A0J5P6B8_9PAST|nr:hypothetical protein [Muribacter muris]KMK51786.1 hypothetical protein RO21_04430 [[Actinobacillus] muris] [Muribacter muris]